MAKRFTILSSFNDGYNTTDIKLVGVYDNIKAVENRLTGDFLEALENPDTPAVRNDRSIEGSDWLTGRTHYAIVNEEGYPIGSFSVNAVRYGKSFDDNRDYIKVMHDMTRHSPNHHFTDPELEHAVTVAANNAAKAFTDNRKK